MSQERARAVSEKKDEDKAVTESISFRLNKNTLEKLRSAAASEKSTLNSFVNHLLTFSIEWIIPTSKTGWVPIPKDSLVRMLADMDEKTISKLGTKIGKSVPKDLLLGMVGRVSVKDWINILKNRAEASGFSYREVDEKNEITYIQQHNMGIKWSIYWNTYYIESFKQLGCEIKSSYTDNTIVYSINKKYLD